MQICVLSLPQLDMVICRVLSSSPPGASFGDLLPVAPEGGMAPGHQAKRSGFAHAAERGKGATRA